MANSSGHMSHHGAQGTVWTLVAPNELARLASLQLVVQLVAARRFRRVQEGTGWVHAYKAQGPDALVVRRTGGRRPFLVRTAKPNWARRSAPPSARPPRRPEPGLIPRHAGRCATWLAGCASASGWDAVARRSGRPCIVSSCRGTKPRSGWAVPIRSGGRPLSSGSKRCWPAPNETSTSWSTSMRRTSIKIAISDTAGPNAGSVSGLPPPRPTCRRASHFTGWTCTTRGSAAVALPARQRRTHD